MDYRQWGEKAQVLAMSISDTAFGEVTIEAEVVY